MIKKNSSLVKKKTAPQARDSRPIGHQPVALPNIQKKNETNKKKTMGSCSSCSSKEHGNVCPQQLPPTPPSTCLSLLSKGQESIYPPSTSVPMALCEHTSVCIDQSQSFPLVAEDVFCQQFKFARGSCNACGEYVLNIADDGVLYMTDDCDMWRLWPKNKYPHPRSALHVTKAASTRSKSIGLVNLGDGKVNACEPLIPRPVHSAVYYAEATCRLCDKQKIPVVTFGFAPFTPTATKKEAQFTSWQLHTHTVRKLCLQK